MARPIFVTLALAILPVAKVQGSGEEFLVWYENSEPGFVEKLEAQDFDEGPPFGPPFTFEIDPKASQDIKSKFSIEKNANGDYWLKTETTFDGEAPRLYMIPIKISNNQWSDITTLLLVIIDKNQIHPDKSINKTASDDFVVGNIERFWEFSPSFSAPNYVPTTIYFSVLYHTTGNGTQCCQECKDIYDPTTSFVNFYEFTSDRETNQYCSCSNYITGDPKTFPTPERIRGFQGQYLTELCDNDSIDVDGDVGEDKHFVAESVDYLGVAPFSMSWTDPLLHARDAAGSCCTVCKYWGSYTRNRKMVEYDRGGKGRCKCIDVKPGKTPTTQNVQWFSDAC